MGWLLDSLQVQLWRLAQHIRWQRLFIPPVASSFLFLLLPCIADLCSKFLARTSSIGPATAWVQIGRGIDARDPKRKFGIFIWTLKEQKKRWWWEMFIYVGPTMWGVQNLFCWVPGHKSPDALTYTTMVYHLFSTNKIIVKQLFYLPIGLNMGTHKYGDAQEKLPMYVYKRWVNSPYW